MKKSNGDDGAYAREQQDARDDVKRRGHSADGVPPLGARQQGQCRDGAGQNGEDKKQERADCELQRGCHKGRAGCFRELSVGAGLDG